MTKNINKTKIVMITILILFEILCIFLMYKTFSNNNSIELFDNKNNNDLPYELAIMIEANTSDGKSMYLESDRNIWPKYGYEYNEVKSGCLDKYGNKLSGVLSFDSVTKIATVVTDQTAYCYLYFDKKENAVDYIITNANEEELWDSTLEGDGYRYVGTNPDNYVCFGYDNVETDCDFTKAENTDKYAYRVIGIFEDDRGIEYVKLIKWIKMDPEKWNYYSDERTWGSNSLFNLINGTKFLKNQIYINNDEWDDKIAIWNYIAMNTKTFAGGISYVDQTVKNVYLHEMGLIEDTSNISDKRIVDAKIGLMYASDYALSFGSSVLNNVQSTIAGTLKTGWMYDSSNDDNLVFPKEWTMTYYAIHNDGKYYAWAISDLGDVAYHTTSDFYYVRPVFYLNFDTTMTGDGTIDSPFIVNK